MKQNEIRQRTNETLDKLIVSLVYDENTDYNIDTIGYLYSYSARNRFIGLMDCVIKTGHYPSAYKTFRQWKQVDRKVKKGEKATYFLRPITVKKEDKNGEEKEETYFKYYPVFESHQTEGKPFRQQNLINGEAPVTLKGIIDVINIPVEPRPDGTATGSTDGKTIWLNYNNNENTLISTIFHEMAHYHLHFKSDSDKKDDKTKELEAEASSFIITKLLGLTNEKSKKYILSWAKDEAQDILIENRKDVLNTVNFILNRIKPIFEINGGK